MPVTDNGPRICSACAAWMRSWPPSSAAVRVRSSLSAKLRCTNVTRELVLAGRRIEANLAQPAVDLFDGRVERLVDRLVIGFAADVRAIELFAVEQHDDGVLELHARHFARERHVADRELVLAVGGEVVRDDEAAARAERHAGQMMLLAARAGRAIGRQRDDHVGRVAVRRRDRQRLGVADGLERDRARRIDVLSDEGRRHLQRVGVVVEIALDVVLRQQRRRVDLEREQVADRVRVLAAVQAAQRDTARRAGSSAAASISLASHAASSSTVSPSGRGPPAGGIRPPRSLRIASSHVSASAAMWSGDRSSNARPPARSSRLWHSTQYFSTTAHCCFGGVGLLPPVGPAADRGDDADERYGYEDLG